MRMRKLVLIPLIGLLLIIVLAVAALFLVDPGVFRGQLEAGAAAAFGRPVQMAGPIRLEKSLRPRIIIEDITIGNPDWTVNPHFADAEQVGVKVALLPLLRGELRILNVSFSGVNVFIEEAPDGSNNYTFGGGSTDEETAGVLPSIDRLQIRDVVINYQSPDADASIYKIAEAQIWNLPGEPERIEGNGIAKDMPFNILLEADIASELSGPQNPWTIKLDLIGSDMTMILTGRMFQAFKFQEGEYRIKISGKEADSLEKLFGVEFPTTGPFDISWALNIAENVYQLKEIAASIQGPSDLPEVRINNGEASGGQTVPLQIGLQGRYGDAPFTLSLASTNPLESTTQTTPWPIAAQLNIGDARLDVESEIIPATAAENLAFDVRLQGETFATLAQILDTEFPKAGSYQVRFHAQIEGDKYSLTDLEGTLKDLDLWNEIRITGGKASLEENGSVKASIKAELDRNPLSLVFEGGPGESGDTGTTTFPVTLEATAPGATLKSIGSVKTKEKENVLQVATQLKGSRLEALGPLVGVSLPVSGKFDISADLNSRGQVVEASNIKAQLGTNKFTGNLQWDNTPPRPSLTGNLSSDNLKLDELLNTGSKSSPNTKEKSLLDLPIKLDGLKQLDAKLDLLVKNVADSPIPVKDIRSAVTLASGDLNASFRAKTEDVPVDGQIQLTQRRNTPGLSLKTNIGQIDIGQTLKQLNFTNAVTGTAEAVHFDGSSSGATLRSLFEQADFNLKIKPADLNYSPLIADQTVAINVSSAEFVARRGKPLAGTFEGTIKGVPFKANLSTAKLAEIFGPDGNLPVEGNLQTEIVQLKAKGSIERPFQNKAFDLEHELTADDIQRIDPLFEFVIPLRGAFRAQGRISKRGNKVTYKENMRIGQSDLQSNITVWRQPERPKIEGSIIASKIHLDDVELFKVDQNVTATKQRSRVIPDYTLPVDILLAADLDLSIKVERLEAGSGILRDFGDMVSQVNLQNGRFTSTTNATGFSGARLNSELEFNAAVDPPISKVLFNAREIDVGVLLSLMGVNDVHEGLLNLYIDLSGTGYTRRQFLGNANGRISVVAGPGKISGRMLDLWAADLVTTMLSPNWMREPVTEMNCMAMHIELKDGQAEFDDILLDTQRITVAGSGVLYLETEAINMLIAPRPKRASLVSLANPVRIEGTLSEPEVSVTRLPRRRRLFGAGAGIFAGLINPAFLLLAFADTGTGGANPCDAAIERAYERIETESE